MEGSKLGLDFWLEQGDVHEQLKRAGLVSRAIGLKGNLAGLQAAIAQDWEPRTIKMNLLKFQADDETEVS